jgi:hypothetical protein
LPQPLRLIRGAHGLTTGDKKQEKYSLNYSLLAGFRSLFSGLLKGDFWVCYFSSEMPLPLSLAVFFRTFKRFYDDVGVFTKPLGGYAESNYLRATRRGIDPFALQSGQ